MSYSFSVRSKNKQELKTKVSEKLVETVNVQGVHEGDCDQAANAAFAFIDLVRDAREDETYVCNLSGSLSWQETYEAGKPLPPFNSANVSASVSVVADKYLTS
jgi:hypothetical protein